MPVLLESYEITHQCSGYLPNLLLTMESGSHWGKKQKCNLSSWGCTDRVPQFWCWGVEELGSWSSQAKWLTTKVLKRIFRKDGRDRIWSDPSGWTYLRERKISGERAVNIDTWNQRPWQFSLGVGSNKHRMHAFKCPTVARNKSLSIVLGRWGGGTVNIESFEYPSFHKKLSAFLWTSLVQLDFYHARFLKASWFVPDKQILRGKTPWSCTHAVKFNPGNRFLFTQQQHTCREETFEYTQILVGGGELGKRKLSKRILPTNESILGPDCASTITGNDHWKWKYVKVAAWR